MLAKHSRHVSADMATEETVDTAVLADAADTDRPAPRLSSDADTDSASPSPARHLQEDLSKMIALQNTHTFSEAKYPLKWTVLGAVVFCSAAWYVVAQIAANL